MRILITGAAGTVGRILTIGLLPMHSIKGLDIENMPLLDDSIIGDISDLNTVIKASRHMDAIIHLSTAKPSQKQWEETFDVSFRGTYNVFEAARQNNVPRVVYASRAGVVDAYPYNVKRTTQLYPIPGSFYTLSKIFAEGLARIYSDKHGIETVGIRIGNIKPHRPYPEDHPKHLSHEDCVRVFERALTQPGINWELVYGVSNSNVELYDVEHGHKAIGYFPQDSSKTDEKLFR